MYTVISYAKDCQAGCTASARSNSFHINSGKQSEHDSTLVGSRSLDVWPVHCLPRPTRPVASDLSAEKRAALTPLLDPDFDIKAKKDANWDGSGPIRIFSVRSYLLHRTSPFRSVA